MLTVAVATMFLAVRALKLPAKHVLPLLYGLGELRVGG